MPVKFTEGIRVADRAAKSARISSIGMEIALLKPRAESVMIMSHDSTIPTESGPGLSEDSGLMRHIGSRCPRLTAIRGGYRVLTPAQAARSQDRLALWEC
jgi:hypothetical protein